MANTHPLQNRPSPRHHRLRCPKFRNSRQAVGRQAGAARDATQPPGFHPPRPRNDHGRVGHCASI